MEAQLGNGPCAGLVVQSLRALLPPGVTLPPALACLVHPPPPPPSGKHYLYLLVSAATAGELAGLFKLGVTDRFPARHRKLTQTWGAFDPARSALLCAGSLRDVERLENSLRYFLGDPRAERAAKAAGRRLTSADFIGMGSWRRHPGRCADGHTEFYALGCLDAVLAVVEEWVACHCAQGTGLRWQRGLDPADCGAEAQPDGEDAPPTKAANAELRARRSAQAREEREAFKARTAARVAQVLELALAHEHRLVWVDLGRWRSLQSSSPDSGLDCGDSFADLYLEGVGAAPSGDGARPQHRSAARVHLEECLAAINVPAALDPGNRHACDWRQFCNLEDPPYGRVPDSLVNPLYIYPPTVPHPLCASVPRLRLNPVLLAPARPYLGEFEGLAQRVEGRRRREQMELC